MSIVIFCSECNKPLDIRTKDWSISGDTVEVEATVDPCDHCIDAAHTNGYDTGYTGGQESAMEDLENTVAALAVAKYKEIEENGL